jgi:GT2 family glycosyltransferase
MPVDAHRTKKPVPKAPIRRDFLTGCALLIKKEVFNQIGFFDERFFLYYEDLDFLLRAKQENLKAWLVPNSKLLHKKSLSRISQNSEKTLYWMARSKWLYFKKHANLWQWFFIVPWQCGHFVKTIINLIIKREFKKLRPFLLGFFLINTKKYGATYSK